MLPDAVLHEHDRLVETSMVSYLLACITHLHAFLGIIHDSFALPVSQHRCSVVELDATPVHGNSQGST